MSESVSPIAAALKEIRARIAVSAAAVDRDPATVTLVAVSKTHPLETARLALQAGQRVFGENRVQEAKAKWPALRSEFPDLVLHLIGPLQTNKVREALALFDVIETLDRPRLAEAIADEQARSGHRPRLLVQVNTGDEPQKAGLSPVDVPDFLAACRDQWRLSIAGLMCIPPVDEEPALHFALLADLARRHGLAQLSMGMSGDFETAVRFGATHVRVGTAIFGARPATPD
ncbi:MAG: YggS family pyridoxal phosphate-dependent enzyme [Azospirillaceae bacterium]|nr:YggS family pyridoxal phosphate-dependent enzyme [Azospirillaceae bacterium]